MISIFNLLYFVLLLQYSLSELCDQRITNKENGDSICLCNSTYCDTIPRLNLSTPNSYQLYSTSREGLGFNTITGNLLESTRDGITTNRITINRQEKHQNIIGFGGAFTDSFGINVLSLPEEAQQKLLESYFGDDGVGYSLCRVPIGGTDFSLRPYSYDDTTDDVTLEHFALQDEDLLYKIPLIQKAKELRGDQPLNLLSSAWSAPIWMKTNNAWRGIGVLKPEYYQTWAEYYMKFFKAYSEHGIEFWGTTPQNEPLDGFFPIGDINSMGWTPEQMNHWIGTYLGPAIRNSEFNNLKIIAFDENLYALPFLQLLFKNDTTLSYLDGVATHWYVDQLFPSSFLQFTKTDKKDLVLLSTEACNGFLYAFGLEPAVVLGSWTRGEKYIESIIRHLENDAGGWIDWNMALNISGGPVYIDNTVDSPIIVNKDAGEFYKQPMYYALGHFSKFIIPDSVRIGVKGTVIHGVHVLAFDRPDNLTAVIIYNKNSEDIQIEVKDTLTAKLKINSKSINTLIY